MCDDMACILAEEDLLRLSRGITVIGDIAILSLPSGIDTSLRDMADALVARRKNIRTVLNKVTGLEGDHRVPGTRSLRAAEPSRSTVNSGFPTHWT